MLILIRWLTNGPFQVVGAPVWTSGAIPVPAGGIVPTAGSGGAKSPYTLTEPLDLDPTK